MVTGPRVRYSWRMRIRQLEHFLAVAEARNFRRAAERTNLSQQAISKSILQLEHDLSLRLFERGRQAVLLTEEGKQLLSYARDILADVRRFDDAVADTMGRQFGHLRIGATPNLLSEVIPDTLQTFHERFPQTRLTVERGDFPLLRDMMLQGDLDLVLSSAPDQVPRDLVSTSTVARDCNVVVVRSGHPLATSLNVSPEDLSHYPHLAFRNYPRGVSFLNTLFAGRAVPRPALLAASTDFATAWLQRSDFWWIASSMQVRRHIQSGTMKVLPMQLVDTGWDLLWSTRRNARPTRHVSAYREIVEAYLATAQFAVYDNQQLS
ncbi:LysR family transcriptional regulator [Novosphingobium sp. SL115]|uniref:LysR family transcriptional regulator n=1 Tax=Novosphingobium sp. SL115 TaxID=2995150 RepID=UPI002276AFBA|nr:LysR family transcriptional regulator [Novosphingobium sp. SL115]MCY1672033.1 LysR family transcriptional regulator [Novosphingobium sp. SL115]